LHGAVLEYSSTVYRREGEGREGRRDLDVFRVLERGYEGGAYCMWGVAQGDHREGPSLFVGTI